MFSTQNNDCNFVFIFTVFSTGMYREIPWFFVVEVKSRRWDSFNRRDDYLFLFAWCPETKLKYCNLKNTRVILTPYQFCRVLPVWHLDGDLMLLYYSTWRHLIRHIFRLSRAAANLPRLVMINTHAKNHIHRGNYTLFISDL